MPQSTSMPVDKHSKIVIVGSGAWGLSTALHLIENGYSDVSVFDRAESIPSPYSAANDLNKIVRAEYEDPFYTQLALEAIQAWKSPLFGPYYHQTGYIVATTGSAPEKAKHHLTKALSSVQAHPAFRGKIVELKESKDFADVAWQMTGPLSGFTGYFNSLAGYAHSADTLRGVWEHCARRGVKFTLGDACGGVVSINYSSGGKASGVTTADGRCHAADIVVVATGAHGASLIPQLGKFNVARCWSVAHVQLNQAETDLLRGIPVVNVRDCGFFFEPDPATRLFKLCPLGAGYTNTNSNGVSLPPPDKYPAPQDFIPVEDERKLRRLLRETFPWMADRPFVQKSMCWFSDTRDSDYCIDFVPNTQSSVIALSGDSGHGFKMMPVFGKWVKNLIEEGRQGEARWQWRQESDSGDWGNAVSWRIGEGGEVNDLIKAKAKLERARL